MELYRVKRFSPSYEFVFVLAESEEEATEVSERIRDEDWDDMDCSDEEYAIEVQPVHSRHLPVGSQAFIGGPESKGVILTRIDGEEETNFYAVC